MSIIDDAADIIRPHIKNAQQEPEYSDDNDDHDIEAAAALHRAGMLTPKTQTAPADEEYRGTGYVESVEWKTRGADVHIQHAVRVQVAIPVDEFAGLDINRPFTITQEANDG